QGLLAERQRAVDAAADDLPVEAARRHLALIEDAIVEAERVELLCHHGERRFARDAAKHDHAVSTSMRASTTGSPPRMRSGIAEAPMTSKPRPFGAMSMPSSVSFAAAAKRR